MPSNSDHNSTAANTGETADETDTAPDQNGGQSANRSGTVISRRHALVGAGLGLGLLNRPSQTPRERPWNQDVDANGHDLRVLGGLNMEAMAEDDVITDFSGANLEIDGTRLRLKDQLDVETATVAELAGGLTGGDRVNDIAGDGLDIDDGRLEVTSNWTREEALLEPSDDDVDGIEVGEVQSPDEESLEVEGESDLVLSIDGDGGAVRIETPGGHEIVLDGADESESVSVQDSAGNSIEMDANSETVSISANQKIELTAPEIELSADADIDVDSDGTARFASSGATTIDGAIVNVGGSGGSPAASVGDIVEEGVIDSGNPTVLL